MLNQRLASSALCFAAGAVFACVRTRPGGRSGEERKALVDALELEMLLRARFEGTCWKEREEAEMREKIGRRSLILDEEGAMLVVGREEGRKNEGGDLRLSLSLPSFDDVQTYSSLLCCPLS